MMDIQKLLPFILRHENVAVIEHGVLYITDRQSYPFEIRRVACSDASETADAIRRMVTQGGRSPRGSPPCNGADGDEEGKGQRCL